MFKQLLAFKNAYLNSEDGVTAIEYGLIAAAVAVALTATGAAFGDEIKTLYTNLTTELSNTGSGLGGS